MNSNNVASVVRTVVMFCLGFQTKKARLIFLRFRRKSFEQVMHICIQYSPENTASFWKWLNAKFWTITVWLLNNADMNSRIQQIDR